MTAQQTTDDPHDDLHDELKAHLRTRQELGPEMEEEVVDSFLKRMQDAIDERVEARVADSLDRQKPKSKSFLNTGRLAVVICLAIPLVAVAGSLGGELAVLGVMVFALVALFKV